MLLAGFDGFSADINENYYEKGMRHTISSSQAHERNDFYKKLIASILSKGNVKFVTPSMYESADK